MKTIWTIIGGLGAMMILCLVMIVVTILHLPKTHNAPTPPVPTIARCHCGSQCPCKSAHKVIYGGR